MSTISIIDDAPRVYTEVFQIKSYHVDVHRRLTSSTLCSFFQDIAGNHTIACGVGWELLQQANIFWVLSRLKIEVNKFPEWRDEISIRTWSNGLDGLMAIRHFQVLNAKGDELVKAISSWVTVNTETRRLVRADDYMRDFPLNHVRLFAQNPDKLLAPDQGDVLNVTPVQYTEVDMNRHTNNVSYIDRIINTYDFNFLMEHRIKNFEINFQKEALPGDVLGVKQQKIAPLQFLNSIVRQPDDFEMIRTFIEWEKY